jgi:eukaryotic-like serine/threonine-protein kinase
MKNYIFTTTLFLFALLLLLSCDTVDNNETIQGTGNLVSLDQNITDFTNIETGFAFESTITRDTVYKVTVTLDDNIVDHLKVTKEGSTLKVFMDENFDYHDVTLKVDITMPDVQNINLSGASASVISGFNFTHDLNITLSGASAVSGTINTGNLILELSGASNVSFSGNGINLIVNGSGASVLSLGNFNLSGNANLVLSGASVSTIRVNGTLNATLSGASVLRYHGNPALGTIITTGESIVIKL